MSNENLKAKTANGLFWGGVGSGTMQFLSMVFGIFLARLLNAEDYGIVGMLAIFSQLASAFCESGFTKALLNRGEIKHRDYNSVFWFGLITGVLCYAVLFFCAPLIARFYHEPRLVKLSRYIFLGVLLSSVQVVPLAYMIKTLMVKQQTVMKWAALVISNGVGIFMAFKGFAHWGIATQSLLYLVVTLVFSFYYSKWMPNLKISFRPVKEMLPYSIKLLGTRCLNIINANLYTVFLAKFFSLKTVGNYNQANKWGIMGYSFLTVSMDNITHPVLASIDISEKERHYAAFRKLVRFAAFIGFPLMFGLAFVAKEFIVILITDKWIESAAMLSILSVGYAFFLISRVLSDLLAERGRSDWYLYASAVSCVLQMACLFVLYPYGIKIMLLSGIGVQGIVLLVWYLFVRRAEGYKLKHFLGDVFSYAAIAVLCIAVVYALLRVLPVKNLYALFFFKVFAVAGLYTGVLYALKSVMLRESFQYLKDKIKKIL